MKRLVTTNLRFSDDMYRDLRHQARRRGTTLAAVVREAVAVYLGRTDESNEIPFGDDPADALVGLVKHSFGDESVNHDHYLYGWDKVEWG